MRLRILPSLLLTGFFASTFISLSIKAQGPLRNPQQLKTLATILKMSKVATIGAASAITGWGMTNLPPVWPQSQINDDFVAMSFPG